MTTIATIVKATSSILSVSVKGTDGVENRTFKIEGTSKGVPGQFDKLVDLINQLPEGEIVIEAGKLKGIFKALKECSKHCTTFSFVLACNGWGLESEGDNSWVIVRPQGNITLINGSYTEPTQVKGEVVTVSEVTQNEGVKVKPKTFCQLLREEWLPSRESWVIDTLKRKMRATWKARKELTCERQAKFMAEFFRRLDVYSPNTELPLQAFLTTYDLVKEDMTGQKTQVSVPEALKVIQKDHNTEEVNDAYTNHLNNLLNKFPDRSVETVTQPSITPVENLEEEFQLTSPEELPERVVVDDKDIYLDEGVCKAIRQACMQLMAENLKGGNEFYKGKYTGSYTVYEPEFWLAKAHQQLHGYCFENYVEEKDTGDLTVKIVRESYRTTPAGDTARAFLGTLGLVSEEVALDWEICINTPNADEEGREPGQLTVGDCFEFGLVW